MVTHLDSNSFTHFEVNAVFSVNNSEAPVMTHFQQELPGLAPDISKYPMCSTSVWPSWMSAGELFWEMDLSIGLVDDLLVYSKQVIKYISLFDFRASSESIC